MAGQKDGKEKMVAKLQESRRTLSDRLEIVNWQGTRLGHRSVDAEL